MIGTTAPGQRSFVVQKIQPGLPGPMDGSVSILAPIFATVGGGIDFAIGLLLGRTGATEAGNITGEPE